MVGRGVCRRAYWQAHVQCSDARDLSAPLTWQRGAHSDTQAQSFDSSPFLCHVVESSHPSAYDAAVAKLVQARERALLLHFRAQASELAAESHRLGDGGGALSLAVHVEREGGVALRRGLFSTCV